MIYPTFPETGSSFFSFLNDIACACEELHTKRLYENVTYICVND
jgi:hypothetical protein